MHFVLDNAYINNVCFSPSSQLSINDFNVPISLGVYPNPFTDAFTLKYDADKNETVLFELTDMLGRLINTNTWNVGIGSNRLNLNTGSLPAGIYLIKLISPTGFAVKNIIKQ